jgi:MerR family transcriptional regulator, Zn(II)-responsive regulator of zntA
MARLSHSTVRTVRFYEETGVLQPAHRSEGGHRLFPHAELDKLVLVTDMRAAGLSLDEIKAVLLLKEGAPTGKAASSRALSALRQHVEDMSSRIEALSRLRDELAKAAQFLEHCGACENDAHFPDQCGNCRVMEDRARVPRAVRVLWAVDAPAAGGEDDQASDDDALP